MLAAITQQADPKGALETLLDWLTGEGGADTPTAWIVTTIVFLGVALILGFIEQRISAYRARRRRSFEAKVHAAVEQRLQQQSPELSDRELQILADAVALGVSGEDVATAVEARLAALEARLPQDATLDKVANSNYAILGTKLDNVQEAVKELRERALSRWDVVVVVFGILAALAATAALVGRL